jgi:serine/threonine protein kinase
MQNSDGMRLASIDSTTSKESKIMSNAEETETSGLQNRHFSSKVVLPDGSQPLQLSSGYISGILGQGGAAVLYEIRNKDLGFQRAVKLLRPNHNSESLQRFLKEFQVCAQLSHPNIPVVHTVGQWHGLPFIEMEKVTGFSLLEMITKFAPLPVGLVTAIGISICKALDYIHHCKYEIDKKIYNGFLHLDLKPSNIMLSDMGLLKILDYGMATPLLEAKKGLHPDSSIGTSQYIAPEILFGRSVPDARSDIFSLGCILFELATGLRVFSGSSLDEIMGMRKSHSIPSIKKIDKSIPESLIRLIEKCLSFEKESRPENAISVRHQLEKIHHSQTSAPAEDVISLYTSKRKLNEPFIIPAKSQNSSSMVLYTSGIVSALCVGILAFSFLWKKDELEQVKTSLLQKAHLIAPFISTGSPVVIATKDSIESSKQNETVPISEIVDSFQTTDFSEANDFYQSPLNPKQLELMDSLRNKWTNRKFDELRLFINKLPKDLASNKEVLLYKLRSMGRNGEELGIALSSSPINDGEYFFHKARFLSDKQNYAEALECLKKAEELPSEFIDKKTLGTEVQLYRSRNLTALFREKPTSENLNNAMNAWQKLLAIVKDRPNSFQAREAIREKENLTSEASWRGIN